jgi:predicted nucleotidyltransferase
MRTELAREVARAYASNPSAAAVVLGGSVARGHADEYSDIELSVIWREAPSEADRAGAIAAAQGDLVWLYPLEDGVWSDAWKVGRRDDVPFTGIEVDMSHYLVETVERVLRDVVERCDQNPTKQLGVGGILNGIALHGAALVAGWQERAASYPDGLRLAVVQAHAQIEGLWRLDAFAERDNPVAGYHVLVAAHEDLLHVLLGLNRMYYAGFKSLPAVVGELRIAPPDLLERLRGAYPLQAGRSKDLTTALVEDVHDLIEIHLPEIDVQRLREILRYERPRWDGT